MKCNTITQIYNNILNEAFVLDKKIYKPIMDYYISAYEKFKRGKVKRITDKKFPVVKIPLNLKGTQREFLQYLDPYLNVELTNNFQSFYSDREKKIMLSFINPTRELIDVIEHEVNHAIQSLIATDMERKYKNNPNMIKKEDAGYTSSRKTVAGVSKDRYREDKTVDLHGYIKYYEFYLSSGSYIYKNKNGKLTFFVVSATDSKDALKQFKKAYKKYELQTMSTLIDDSNINKVNVGRHIPRNLKRTLHTYRPIEYHTDLISNLRHLQHAYYQSLENSSPLEKEVALGSEKARKAFFIKQLNNKTLIKFGTHINRPELYKSYIKELYKYFVSQNIPYENFEDVKRIIDINKKVAQDNIDKLAKEQKININGIDFNESYFNGYSLKQNVRTCDYSNLDDNNFEFIENTLGKLGVYTYTDDNSGDTSFNIKIDYKSFVKIFKNLRNIIIDSNNNKETIKLENGETVPEYYNYIYFGWELFKDMIQKIDDFDTKFKKVGYYEIFKYFLSMSIEDCSKYRLDC